MQDIPDAILSLVTSVFVPGVGDVEEARMVAERLGLNPLLREQLTALGKPGPRGANMIAQFRTSEGAHHSRVNQYAFTQPSMGLQLDDGR